jgi:hypothetical protein
MNKTVHRRQFDGGRRSPQEFHAQFAFPPDAKCQGCQAKPSIRAIVMMPLDEAEKKGMIPKGAAGAPMVFPGVVPLLVPIKDGSSERYFLRVSMTYSCSRCQKDFEKSLAKAPSYCIVEINRGPDPTNRVVVGRS